MCPVMSGPTPFGVIPYAYGLRVFDVTVPGGARLSHRVQPVSYIETNAYVERVFNC